MVNHFDIIIVGAGPAGTTAALELRKHNYTVALLDKSTFPRDKICGDAIPGPAFRLLEKMERQIGEDIWDITGKEKITAAQLFAPNGKEVKIFWKTTAYNAPRQVFDNRLLQLVKKYSATTLFENALVRQIKIQETIAKLKLADGRTLSASIVIGCDGANSVVARQLTDFLIKKESHCAAVRWYGTGITGVEAGTNEFHYLQDVLPGYFWIFPIGNGHYNIGFGMLSHQLERQPMTLRQRLEYIVREHPQLSPRFKHFQPLDKIRGFGLPLGTQRLSISGNRFMLCGDAASLIDPLQGHGIDKAMQSGQLAAQQAIHCLQTQQFSAAFMATYDQNVYQKMWFTFRRNHFLMRILAQQPWLVNMAIGLAQRKWLKEAVQRFL